MDNTKEVVTATTEESIISIVSFTNKLLSYGEEIGRVMVAKAPEAYEALLDLIRFKSAFILAENFLLFIVVLAFTISMWVYGIPYARRVDKDCRTEGFTTFLIGFLPTIILTVMCVEVFFINVLDFQTILGVFYPEGYLALKALNTVGVDI